MIKGLVRAWSHLIRDLKIYKPDFKLIGLRLIIWLLWTGVCHYAWLRIGLFFPVTAFLLSPMLYWSLKSLVEEAYLKVLLSTKLLFEQTAAQVGSGYAIQNGLIYSIESGLKAQRFYETVDPILEKMLFKLRFGLMDDQFYEALIAHTKIEGLGTLSVLIEASLKTGSQLDQLMIYYANLLSEQLKQRSKFRETISQKRSEFHLMLLIPVIGILLIQKLIPEYYEALSLTFSGIVLSVVATALYGLSAHLFYRNQERFNEFLSTW